MQISDPLRLDRDPLLRLRHELHRHPEVSHDEAATAERIARFLQQTGPDELLRGLGGHGLAAVYRGREAGPTVMIRCELDALPLIETGDPPWRSTVERAGHLCGHDGHMTMVAGVGQLLQRERPPRGRVVLLYQPAEETGEGARRILADPAFEALRPDRVFALHNLPGHPAGEVVLRRGVFASASRGLILHLEGATSHAGEPRHGRNPALAAGQIVSTLLSLPSLATDLHEAAMVTPVAVRVGGPAFGTSAGEGEVMFTLRAHADETLERMGELAVERATALGGAHGLSVRAEWTEDFEAVKNDDESVALLESVAGELGCGVTHLERPFAWSEDFGVFTSRAPGALFGLGVGEDHPPLHSGDYDFPDEVLETGVHVFHAVCRRLLWD